MRLPFFQRKALGVSDYMTTFTGVTYWPASPRARDVRLADIAHHLSMLCRFTGAVREFYSVAEHSVHVSLVVPAHLALIGLMHDAAEAYTNDVSRPLKRSLPDYQRIEHLNWLAIAERFKLPEFLPPEIHKADMAVLRAEQNALMPPSDLPDGLYVGAADIAIHCWSPAEAEKVFLDRFYQLTRALGEPARVCGYNRPVLQEMATC